ncbi:MgtC/SapB family protein [Dyadobacter fanqingshengii]|uniref:MgtC/SapB family protein n=1 Tax=Dyadobacter fanqingshengii TaxID=2906443 RepID=A0A9X1PGG1_9BACT|nr:MgtC/SapB family protein [Dyadobacter fanqingshengii]MCF0043290.1 MgtC/SapB family protein [Dyadobacter fanqingshengii]MCF2504197.1 MgtC/SapB family protein [Dyadobacter fanqingshengii]USJ35763.1 MgtC/SapB family protein [Dyadobacter fanqingshengii]
MELLPEDVYKLLISFFLGAIIGTEREYRSKSAGLRTMILIAVGSTLFTIISIKISSDAGRIAANIVTGIGFIGAGIIFRENNRVVGITTAAIVWVTAAVGMGIGAGFYEVTIATFIISGLSLVILAPIQKFIRKKSQIRNYRLVCPYERKTLKRYEELFKDNDLKILQGQQSRSGGQITGSWTLQGSEKKHEKLTHHLLNDSGIIEFDF